MIRARGALILALSVVACERPSLDPEASTSASAGARLAPPDGAPSTPVGMRWIAGGPLVVGTPPDALPRIADREMPGEQVVLRGFHMDTLPFPNEEGAIPITGVTREEAAARCEELGKRLCSELEWERACKGPDNRVYEYGDVFEPERCGSGGAAAMRPAGIRPRCVSDFGVRDLHGGVYEWTDSPWGRDDPRALGTLRGGFDENGALGGRCAHATPKPPADRAANVGFRCCLGTRNTAEVTLSVARGEPLEVRAKVDRELGRSLFVTLREEQRRTIKKPEKFVFDRNWLWRPTGNEVLNVLGGCSGFGYEPSCGIVVGRVGAVRPLLLAWVASERYAPVLQPDADARVLWLYGGDEQGTYRRRIRYDYGDLSIGPKERELPKPKKKKKPGSRGR